MPQSDEILLQVRLAVDDGDMRKIDDLARRVNQGGGSGRGSGGGGGDDDEGGEGGGVGAGAVGGLAARGGFGAAAKLGGVAAVVTAIIAPLKESIADATAPFRGAIDRFSNDLSEFFGFTRMGDTETARTAAIQQTQQQLGLGAAFIDSDRLDAIVNQNFQLQQLEQFGRSRVERRGADEIGVGATGLGFSPSNRFARLPSSTREAAIWR